MDISARDERPPSGVLGGLNKLEPI